MSALTTLLRRITATLAVGVVAIAATACGAGQEEAAPGQASATGAQIETLREGTLTVATTSDGKPNCYIENGEFKGFDLDLLRAMATKLGLQVEFSAIEFPALLPAVSAGRFDMGAASTAGTVERQQIVDFSQGYLGGYLGVLTTQDSGITQDNASTAGKRLGLLQGTIQEAYAKRFLPDATIVTFPDNNAGVAALRNGRVDAYFLDFVVGTDYIDQYPELVQPIALPAFDQPAAFAMRKGNTALQEGLNRTLTEVVQDGTWQRLYDQYFAEAPDPESLPPYALPTA